MNLFPINENVDLTPFVVDSINRFLLLKGHSLGIDEDSPTRKIRVIRAIRGSIPPLDYF